LRAEAKKRELVGGEPGGGAFRKVVKGAFFGGSGERAIDAAGGDEGHGWNRGGAHGWSFLFTEGVAGGAECEFERFAGDGLDERADGPAEAAGNGARQRNGFDLHGQAAVVLLVTPVSVLAPEEAVGVGGAEGMFCRRACTVDLGDIRAARDAVAMAKVEVAEVDIVGGIHNNGDDMVLADSHERLEAVVVPGESFGLEDFGREVLWVRVEVAHQAFEVGGGGSGDEGSAAPVVKEGSGDGGWGKLLDDEVAAAEATLVCGDEEDAGGMMLLSEAGFDAGGVGVEGGKGFGGGLSRAGRDGQEKQERIEDAVVALHGLQLVPGKRARQWKEAHLWVMGSSRRKCLWACYLGGVVHRLAPFILASSR